MHGNLESNPLLNLADVQREKTVTVQNAQNILVLKWRPTPPLNENEKKKHLRRFHMMAIFKEHF